MTRVPDRPLLSPWHRLVQQSDRLVLEYGAEAVAFEGRAAATLLPALLPLLDGTSTTEEIALAFGEDARPAVENALALLAEHGVLTGGPPLGAALPRPFAAAALLHAAVDANVSSPEEARAAIAAAHIRIVGSSHTAAEVARVLRVSGVRSVEMATWESRGDALAVVAPSRDELDRLPTWNDAALAAEESWLQVLPFNGAFLAIGPLYVPGETCCYECYRRRRATNVDYPDEFWALERSLRGAPDAPTLAVAAAGIAATVALRWILFRDAFAAATLLALELRETLRLTEHVVYRVPRCPACSSAQTRAQPLPWAEVA